MTSFPGFFDKLVLRSQCWCLVSLADRRGFSVGANDAILLYMGLKGSVTLSVGTDRAITLNKGDMVAVLDCKPHTVRSGPNCIVDDLSFLNSAQYVDAPTNFSFGPGDPQHQILCGRFKVRWPADFRPSEEPAFLKAAAADNPVRFDVVLGHSKGKGASATLTHAGSLMLVAALQQHPAFQVQLSDGIAHDPITRAVKLMQEALDCNWTVSSLAREVGMGRTVFATGFLTKIGKPPFEVLTEFRMERARDLLLRSDLKLSEIAECVGYRSESAFHRRFSSHFGAPPGKMRCTAVLAQGSSTPTIGSRRQSSLAPH